MIQYKCSQQKGYRREKGGQPLLEKGVMPMDKKFKRQVLRTLLCAAVIFWLLVYLAPKAC